MFANFFIRRPIVAMVISILIVLMGLVAYPTLPVAQYPDITPPVIQVEANFPGASAQVVADTVAAPIEEKVNGVPGMLYMESTSSSDGSYTLKVTFELGVDIDIASVLVQNRVATAMPKLPEEVTRNGVTTDKVSSSIINIFTLAATDDATQSYDDLFLSNYLTINVLDEIKRINGVGDAMIIPAKDYALRVWLDPNRLDARSLTVMDVIGALREQNVQVAAGTIGQPPAPAGLAYQYSVSALGRLDSVEQFENVVVRADDASVILLKDVARVELGGKSYSTIARFNGKPTAAMIVYLTPGGNAVKVAEDVSALLESKGALLPDGLAFEIVYDTSEFVLTAIEAVYHTFFEALVLVLLVVVVFLGSLRTSLIPMLAIPVSIIGTFFIAKALGFSINMPVLFALILAIGIVVDDAIVVVENVERIMVEQHLPPKEATAKAMAEVMAPVISMTVVLIAVFLPTAFLPGISGQLFKQFALIIVGSTLLSGVCAVTLTPALCGLVLKAHKPGKGPSRFNRIFNATFNAISGAYASMVRFLVHPAVIVFTLAAFAAGGAATVWSFGVVPTGFVPNEDRGLVLVEVWMPDSASLERTVEAMKKVEHVLADTEGVESYCGLGGYSMLNGNGSNYAAFFARLQDWDERLPEGRDVETIMQDVRSQLAVVPDGLFIVFMLPAVDGVGNASGFDLRIQDRAGIGRQGLQEIVQRLVSDGNAQSKLTGVSSSYRAAVPQLFIDVDREKAKKLGLPLQDVFATLSGYLAPFYVNDFNLFGRTWQVTVSADSQYRDSPDQITALKVRTPSGAMAPLGSLVDVRQSMGADRVVRYNLFPAATLNGQPAPGVSSGESLAVVESMTDATLPPGVVAEWTALSYQEKLVGNQAVIVFGMALLIVYLILAGLYESWIIPLAVILSIPLAVLGAMTGLIFRGMDNNVYTQVGLVLLVGLGAKNAILIVEFAKAYHESGKSVRESAIEASRQRMRPILMTALAFILGVLPLMIATGAGAASRQAIGTAVFFGMIGNTFLGLIFTPVLYVAIQGASDKLFGRKKHDAPPAAAAAPKPAH